MQESNEIYILPVLYRVYEIYILPVLESMRFTFFRMFRFTYMYIP